jgi:hypothetical protein
MVFVRVIAYINTEPHLCLFVCLLVSLWEMAWYEATAKEYHIISEVYLQE